MPEPVSLGYYYKHLVAFISVRIFKAKLSANVNNSNSFAFFETLYILPLSQLEVVCKIIEQL